MKTPKQFKRPYHVNYLQGFWFNLVSDIIKSARTQALPRLNRFILGRFSFKQWLKKKDRTITIKIRWVVAGLLVLALWPHPQKIVYGDPISPAPTVHKIALISKLPEPQTASETALDPIPVYVPPPPPPVVYTAPVSYGDARSYALSQVGAAQFSCLDALWNKESGWRVNAYNPSGAYGIPQSLPGSKMASAGADWQTNPITQVNWGLSYIASVYGTPCGAWAHSVAYNWY